MSMLYDMIINALTSNSKLLIIGYGFSDLYINSALIQYISMHASDKKVVMIDYVDKHKWNPNVEHPFSPSDKAVFTNLMFSDDFWCRKPSCWEKESFYQSNDKRSIVFTDGFLDVIDSHISNVIEVLNQK